LTRSIDINDLCHNLGLPTFGGKILAERAGAKNESNFNTGAWEHPEISMIVRCR
jgi:hypothetical protein